MNQVFLEGKAGRDAKFGTTSNGKMWANISVATSEKYKDTWNTTWHNVVGWGKQAETISQIKKGAKVYVSGKIQTREYEKEGVKKQSFEILAWTIGELHAGQAAEFNQTASAEPEFGNLSSEEELPF